MCRSMKILSAKVIRMIRFIAICAMLGTSVQIVVLLQKLLYWSYVINKIKSLYFIKAEILFKNTISKISFKTSYWKQKRKK